MTVVWSVPGFGNCMIPSLYIPLTHICSILLPTFFCIVSDHRSCCVNIVCHVSSSVKPGTNFVTVADAWKADRAGVLSGTLSVLTGGLHSLAS